MVTSRLDTVKAMLPSPISLEEVRCLFQQLLARNHDKPRSQVDPIFISCDIAHGNHKRFSAIGASTLDTSSLTSPKPPTPTHRAHVSLHTETFNFQYGQAGVKRKQERALFHGQVNQVRWSERAAVLRHIFSHSCCDNGDMESCFRSHDLQFYGSLKVDESNKRGVPIILVGHDIPSDLRSLSKAGVSITDIASILAIIDTQKLAREMYKVEDAGWNISLRKLCRLVGMMPRKLHDCGNDAAWTLLALLSLAKNLLDEEDEGREILEEVLREGIRDSKTKKQVERETRVKMKDPRDWADNLVAEGI